MKSRLCLCLGRNLCKSPKSPPVIFHNRPNVPVNVAAAEQNCNYIFSSTSAHISSTVNCISPIDNCTLPPTWANISSTVYLVFIICQGQSWQERKKCSLATEFMMFVFLSVSTRCLIKSKLKKRKQIFLKQATELKYVFEPINNLNAGWRLKDWFRKKQRISPLFDLVSKCGLTTCLTVPMTAMMERIETPLCNKPYCTYTHLLVQNVILHADIVCCTHLLANTHTV